MLSTKDFSNAQESMVADFLGWKKVSGSGAASCTAGDVVSDKFLAECKTHETRNHKVVFRQDVWKKICDEAMAFGRKPVLISDDGSQDYRRTYCMTYKPVDMSFLPKSEFFVTDYNVSFKKQLNFDPDKLYAKFKKNEDAVLVISWVDDVVLMNLQTFAKYQQYA